jgi:hypothetical protein
MPLRRRFWILTALAAILAAAIAIEYLWWSAATEILIPLLGVASFLWGGRLLYFWQRRESHERRKARREKDPAEPIPIPPDVRKPESYDGVDPVHFAQWGFQPHATGAQGVYFANGIIVALLPSLALLLLSAQILIFPSRYGWALGLIASEASCLFLLVYFAWSHPRPTADWTEARMRSELLRREQYLIVAGCGPYLQKPAGEAVVRLGDIKGASKEELMRFILLEDPVDGNWLEALHKTHPSSLAPRADLPDRIKTYLYHRIVKQLRWFGNEDRDCEENERNWNRSLKFATLAAFIVAVAHMMHLLSSLHSLEPQTSWSMATTTLGISLPPLGTAFLNIGSMYAFHHRRRLYQRTNRRLQEHKGAADKLLAEVESKHPHRPITEIDLDFRSLVLRVEQTLSNELEQWLLLMDRSEYEV